MPRLLTEQNYRHGFLVDDEVIAGVTPMAKDRAETQIFSAYVSHYLTGETYVYQEFEALGAALDFLGQIDRPWNYEAVGCSTKTGATATKSGCQTGACQNCGTSSD